MHPRLDLFRAPLIVRSQIAFLGTDINRPIALLPHQRDVSIDVVDGSEENLRRRRALADYSDLRHAKRWHSGR